MKTEYKSYQEDAVLIPTARLKRYRVLKGAMFLMTLWLTLPLALLSVIGEWAGVVLVLVKSVTHAIQRQIILRFAWDEAARNRQEVDVRINIIDLSAYRSSRREMAYPKKEIPSFENQ